MNSGQMRFPIVLYYKSSETSSAMGSMVPSFTTYIVNADMVELSDNQRLRYGMNIEENAYKFTLRKPVDGRPIKLTYNSVEYNITSCIEDRLSQVLTIIATLVK
jgi:hypothetical protein